MGDRLLRQDEVMRMTGLSRTGIWELERRGEFPRRRRVGARNVAWLESELLEWMRSRPVVAVGRAGEGEGEA